MIGKYFFNQLSEKQLRLIKSRFVIDYIFAFMEKRSIPIYSKTTVMATIENDIVRKPSKHKHLNKKNTRVDLTPMVDLGFLLITFFVFTTQLSLPTTLHLNMPNDKTVPADMVCSSCVLTVILQADNAIVYYEGMPESNPVIGNTSFSNNGIRNIILQKKRQVQHLKGTADDFVLIVKSADASTFQNFVDMADEVAINNIKHYYLDEMNAADRALLAKK